MYIEKNLYFLMMINMPNWCANKLKINTSYSTAPISKIIKPAKHDVWEDWQLCLQFSNLLPLSWPWNSDKAVELWWTKWDLLESSQTIDYFNWYIHVWFDTAWSPPIAFYDAMAKEWYVFEAYYFEPWVWFIWYYESSIWDQELKDYEVTYDDENDMYHTNDSVAHEILNELEENHSYGWA